MSHLSLTLLNLPFSVPLFWDSSHDWGAFMDGYVLFRKGILVRQDSGVALYAREQLECIELSLGWNDEQVEDL